MRTLIHCFMNVLCMSNLWLFLVTFASCVSSRQTVIFILWSEAVTCKKYLLNHRLRSVSTLVIKFTFSCHRYLQLWVSREGKNYVTSSYLYVYRRRRDIWSVDRSVLSLFLRCWTELRSIWSSTLLLRVKCSHVFSQIRVFLVSLTLKEADLTTLQIGLRDSSWSRELLPVHVG